MRSKYTGLICINLQKGRYHRMKEVHGTICSLRMCHMSNRGQQSVSLSDTSDNFPSQACWVCEWLGAPVCNSTQTEWFSFDMLVSNYKLQLVYYYHQNWNLITVTMNVLDTKEETVCLWHKSPQQQHKCKELFQRNFRILLIGLNVFWQKHRSTEISLSCAPDWNLCHCGLEDCIHSSNPGGLGSYSIKGSIFLYSKK